MKWLTRDWSGHCRNCGRGRCFPRRALHAGQLCEWPDARACRYARRLDPIARTAYLRIFIEQAMQASLPW